MGSSFLSFFTQKGFLFRLGLIVVVIWTIIAILSFFVPEHLTTDQNLAIKHQPPSGEHWFGTDNLGRDVFMRVMTGSGISLTAGIITVACAFFFGILFGGIAGYKGGIIDEAMMRFSEMMISMPPLVLAMVVAAALGPSLMNSILAMVVIWWPNYARLMRSMVLTLKETEYVTAARALGAGHIRVLVREILPNSIGPLLVMATLDLGNAILMFSGLSYLGLGVQMPAPEWGLMVSEGAKVFGSGLWWAATFPGLAIFTLAASTNFVGDGLRDYLDPKLKKM